MMSFWAKPFKIEWSRLEEFLPNGPLAIQFVQGKPLMGLLERLSVSKDSVTFLISCTAWQGD